MTETILNERAARPREGALVRLSQTMVAFSERWFPDAYIFVLLATVAVALAAIVHGGSPVAVSTAFGEGFWSIIPFTSESRMLTTPTKTTAPRPVLGTAAARRISAATGGDSATM